MSGDFKAERRNTFGHGGPETDDSRDVCRQAGYDTVQCLREGSGIDGS